VLQTCIEKAIITYIEYLISTHDVFVQRVLLYWSSSGTAGTSTPGGPKNTKKQNMKNTPSPCDPTSFPEGARLQYSSTV